VLQRILRSLIFLVIMVPLGLQPAVSLAAGIPIIRDTEIENTVRTWSTPIFRAAGLDPSAVEIYIINDKGINAFVAGGQKLFLNTGLLMQSDDANQVIGVIAHEVGHIEGGHLARVHDAMRGATVESIIALVLGAAAGVATGRPDVGAAIAAGGQDAARRSFFRYSQTQEGAADSAAMRLLDATGQSSQGLLDFLRTMEDQELLAVGRQDPYLRSHPLTRDRINALETHVGRSRHTDAPNPQGFDAMHARMEAKLTAFLEPASTTFRRYPESDQSTVARYAHAIAWFRSGNLAKALQAIDALIAAHPEDPHFHELKGQMLFESGRPAEAIGPYRAAVQLLPAKPLLRFELARVQLALNDPRLIEEAIVNLRTGLTREPGSASAWRQLAIAYGRDGQMGESALALAEEALLQGRPDEAVYHAGKAERLLASGSRSWLQAKDIQRFAEQKARRN
jgi:predicted Zn-dependent protease